MRARRLKLVTAIVFLGTLTISVRLPAQSANPGIVTFDAPGAIALGGSFDGTFAIGINNGGTITGIYIDANTLYHGFLRSPGGKFSSLDAPGVGTSVGTRFRPSAGGLPSGANINAHSININDRGTVTGNYIDVNNVSHGFLRNPKSDFITFDAPGARSAAGTFDGSFPSGINKGGAITGNFIDSNGLNHGFLREATGEFTTFDVPGAGTAAGSGFGTFPVSINDEGTIAGHYTDTNIVNHGFVRSPEGRITTFDAPGADTTVPESINAAGAITGHYSAANGYHGFLRSPGGEFTTFDAPGVATGTLPKSINAGGAITGHFTDAHNMTHGFVRSSSGDFTTFDAPGAGSSFGTFPDSINNAGAITGHYTDSQGLNHGFLRLP